MVQVQEPNSSIVSGKKKAISEKCSLEITSFFTLESFTPNGWVFSPAFLEEIWTDTLMQVFSLQMSILKENLNKTLPFNILFQLNKNLQEFVLVFIGSTSQRQWNAFK